MKFFTKILFSVFLFTTLSANGQPWIEAGGKDALAANGYIYSLCSDKSTASFWHPCYSFMSKRIFFAKSLRTKMGCATKYI